MDTALYKDITTLRGLNYHCYVVPTRESKPTLLFLHGFPSTSRDWRHQVSFFREKGYGLIVPDMLGYGGTAKPTNVEAYGANLIAKDIVDILDSEGIQKAILIGHDWGCGVVSRMGNLYPDRVLAFAFLTVGYMAPSPESDISLSFGHELYGYWLFFSEDGADKVIENHWDSFFNLIWPHDPKTWPANIGPVGAAKAWILADKKTALPWYMMEEEKRIRTEILLKDGFAAPLNWYKVHVFGHAAEEDKSVPLDRYDIHQPILFVGCTQDYLCLPEMMRARLAKHCKDVTYKEIDSGHWLMSSHPDELNKELLAWIEAKV